MDWEEYKNKKQWAGKAKPSMTRRRIGHDYYGRCIYMVTLVVNGRQPLLGTIKGDGEKTPAKMLLSDLGNAVSQALRGLPRFYPALQIWNHQVMPDHLHAIFFVQEPIPMHFGKIVKIQGLKAPLTVLPSRHAIYRAGITQQIFPQYMDPKEAQGSRYHDVTDGARFYTTQFNVLIIGHI